MSNRDLDESGFIREKLYGGKTSSFQKYAALVTGSTSPLKVLKYELITGILGPIPGALGLLLRKKFYPLLFKRIGKGVVFGRNVTIRHPDHIFLDDNVIIDDNAFIDGRGAGEEGVTLGKETLVGRYAVIHSKIGPISIGPHCNIGGFSNIVSQGGINIKAWVQIAGSCHITGGLFKFNPSEKDEVPFSRYTKGKIVIEARCYIGSGTYVLDGVTIGKGSMTGAGSIVSQNLPEYSIYIQKPGMIIGKTILDPSQ